MNHFHVLFDFLQLKLFECHFSSSFLNITDSCDLLFWFQRVVCSVTVYWSVNLSDESDYNQVSCINTFFTVLELDLMWWRCTTAVWFSSIVVFSFGCYLICTVFVVCVCVRVCVVMMWTFGVTAVALDFLHSGLQWSACFCCLNKILVSQELCKLCALHQRGHSVSTDAGVVDKYDECFSQV